jgi:hypothetical protein
VSRLQRRATGTHELNFVGGALEYVVSSTEDLPWSSDVEQVRAGHGKEPDALPGAGHESSLFAPVEKCNHTAIPAKLAGLRWSHEPLRSVVVEQGRVRVSLEPGGRPGDRGAYCSGRRVPPLDGVLVAIHWRVPILTNEESESTCWVGAD